MIKILPPGECSAHVEAGASPTPSLLVEAHTGEAYVGTDKSSKLVARDSRPSARRTGLSLALSPRTFTERLTRSSSE